MIGMSMPLILWENIKYEAKMYFKKLCMYVYNDQLEKEFYYCLISVKPVLLCPWSVSMHTWREAVAWAGILGLQGSSTASLGRRKADLRHPGWGGLWMTCGRGSVQRLSY